MIRNYYYVMKIFFREDKKYFFLRLLTILLGPIHVFTQVVVIQMLIDSIFTDTDIKKVLLVISISVIISVTATILAVITFQYYAPRANYKVGKYATKKIYDIYIEKDISEIENQEFYEEYQFLLSKSTEVLNTTFTNICLFISGIFAIISLAGLIIFYSNIVLVLLCVIIFIINTILLPKISKITFERDLELNKANRRISYISRFFYLKEYIIDVKNEDISTLMEEDLDGSFNSAQETLYSCWRKTIPFNLVISFTNSFIQYGVILIYISFLGLRGIITVGSFTALFNSSTLLLQNTYNLSRLYPALYENNLYIKKFISFTSNKQSEVDKLNIVTPSNIELKNISFSYGEKNILENINLELKENSIVAIIGENGVGKTTLVNILSGINKCESTSYISNINDFLYINQEAKIFALTIAENILLRKVKHKDDIDLVYKSLELVGMKDFVHKLPNGIDSILTKEFSDDGINLSGGQRQKIVAARIFATTKKYIILDEFTSAMDKIAEKVIIDNILKECKNKNICLVVHNIKLLRNVDNIFILKDKQNYKSGSYQELESDEYFRQFIRDE